MKTLEAPPAEPPKPIRLCSCGKPVYCKCICRLCYQRAWMRNRSPEKRMAMRAAQRAAYESERELIDSAGREHMEVCQTIAIIAGLKLIDVAKYIQIMRERNRYGAYLKRPFDRLVIKGKRVA